jgi:hypothetical protein
MRERMTINGFTGDHRASASRLGQISSSIFRATIVPANSDVVGIPWRGERKIKPNKSHEIEVQS